MHELMNRSLPGRSFRYFAAVLAVAIISVSCSRVSGKPPLRDVPVYLISIDTLRSDRLPAYGYSQGRTPAIDAFRRDAVLFQYAFSHCPQTLPSHASIFTGLIPPEHGVRDNVGYVMEPRLATLPESLKAQGYVTGAAVSSYVLRRASGVSQGFDFFDDALEPVGNAPAARAERHGNSTLAALDSWMARAGKKRFAFLHLYEPHAPYEPPSEFAGSGRDAYDGEVSAADSVFGKFVSTLKARGEYDDALIVLLSDHGEGLGDHGEDEHGIFVYRESLQVPLIIKLPASERAGEVISRTVGLSEVMPAVLARTGSGAPASRRNDIFSANGRETPSQVYAESYFARLHFGWSELRTLIDPTFQLIEAPERELYAWRTDPGELTNLARSERRGTFALSAALAKIAPRFEGPSAVDPEDQRKLAALGYLGSASTPEGARADPKTKTAQLRTLRKAFILVEKQRFVEAKVILQLFVRQELSIVDGWVLLGRSQKALGRNQEALATLQEGLRLHPAHSDLALLAADTLALLGRSAEARAHAELAMRHDPVLTLEFLARLALRETDIDAARDHLTRALALAPNRTETLLLMADLSRKQSNPAEELRFLDAIANARLAGAPARERVEFRRGEALLALRRIAEAEAAFRNETLRFPRNREAWSSLALVVGAQGRQDESRQILRRALEANDDPVMRKLVLESFEVMGDTEGRRMLNGT